MLRAAIFVGGERAPLAGGDRGTTLQCRRGRGTLRAASNGDNGGGWEGLTIKRWRRWRSDGNQRGGGVSGGGSQRGVRVGGGGGGEYELGLGLGRGTEWSEAPASSPNQRAHGESREGNGGGVRSSVPCGGGRKRERGGSAARPVNSS
jgi:hypothetical protein